MSAVETIDERIEAAELRYKIAQDAFLQQKMRIIEAEPIVYDGKIPKPKIYPSTERIVDELLEADLECSHLYFLKRQKELKQAGIIITCGP